MSSPGVLGWRRWSTSAAHRGDSHARAPPGPGGQRRAPRPAVREGGGEAPAPGRRGRGALRGGAGLAAELGCVARVRQALGHAFERWDGKGGPKRLRGDGLALAARVVQVADDAQLFLGGGVDAVTAMLTARAGHALDPVLARRDERAGRHAAGRAGQRVALGGRRRDGAGVPEYLDDAAARRRAAGDGGVRGSPVARTRAGTRPASPGWRPPPPSGWGSRRPPSRRSVGPAGCTTSVAPACRRPSGRRKGRCRRRVGAGADAHEVHRAGAGAAAAAGPLGRAGDAGSRARRRLRLSERAAPRRCRRARGCWRSPTCTRRCARRGRTGRRSRPARCRPR